MSHTILIVEDEAPIRQLIQRYLEREGYRVVACGSVEEARRAVASHPPDMLILDIMLPGQDGLSFCGELRATSATPVIFVSAKDDEIDRVLGLEMGADDYLAKPFSPRELVARVKTVLRRVHPRVGAADVLRLDDLEIVPRERKARAGENELQLTVKEYDLLSLLVRNKNIALSREQIISQVWGFDFLGDSRAVDDVVKRLRRKLRDAGSVAEISTVWGYGYRVRERGGGQTG